MKARCLHHWQWARRVSVKPSLREPTPTTELIERVLKNRRTRSAALLDSALSTTRKKLSRLPGMTLAGNGAR